VGQCRPYLPPMPVCTETASFLKTLQPGTSIGINISAGHIGGHRTLEQWSQLIKSFTDETFIILSAPKELEEKRKLEQPQQRPAITLNTKHL